MLLQTHRHLFLAACLLLCTKHKDNLELTFRRRILLYLWRYNVKLFSIHLF